ncbi:MAG: hypothetical protein QOG58_5560, partial [Caballeronia sp.]|nr:hypothetical protein [Caballeronia sp.]
GKSTIGNSHRHLGFAGKDLNHGYEEGEPTALVRRKTAGHLQDTITQRRR